MKTSVLAQIVNPVLPPGLGGTGANPQEGSTYLGKLISGLIGVLIIAGFLLTFMELLIGATQWITAGGDKQALEKARNGIINALIGMMIVAAVYALMVFVGKFFGMDITNIPIPTF